MTAVEQDFLAADVHPIDMVETLAEQSRWDFDRLGEDQIAMAIEGAWRTYSLSLAWSGHDDMLRLVCSFELDPAAERRPEVVRLIHMINDKVWNGSFVHWAEQGMLAFRYGLTLAGGATATPEQIEAMVLSAVALSERFYPAFQLVGWGGEAAETALRVAIEEHYGTA
ncbi:YbjN domain-containing protein [Limibaculum sp. FT325]|uniref:YbjN domain-containing protein n=1 Tax=Thermohalobaculum sediminis TaxID=2939436 RepID=UPI0020BEB70F|nr:YbjN domain-containing protein [Limibaculum sediminis]MCL5778438.1 YbjN domain-containing protein [Limibaculum sediminis]